MGNSVSSACSSCKCVKDEKQNEFDDNNEDPLPLQYKNNNLLRASKDSSSSGIRP